MHAIRPSRAWPPVVLPLYALRRPHTKAPRRPFDAPMPIVYFSINMPRFSNAYYRDIQRNFCRGQH